MSPLVEKNYNAVTQTLLSYNSKFVFDAFSQDSTHGQFTVVDLEKNEMYLCLFPSDFLSDSFKLFKEFKLF